MPQNSMTEIIQTMALYKETVVAIITWLWGSVAHIIHKGLNGEKMSFLQHIWHLLLSAFVGYMSYLGCIYMGISWPLQWMIIWMCSYSWIKIIDAFNMIKAKTIYNFILDFIKFKLWKND